ncbi:hypothetical protein [Vibrio injensis]|uniref:hypothetical protein n=1 Tax=Vibrio injensis TaxID=1307414 RepID=UPI0009354B14|nr:hypothetical protein [Vibrio injensis]
MDHLLNQFASLPGRAIYALGCLLAVPVLHLTGGYTLLESVLFAPVAAIITAPVVALIWLFFLCLAAILVLLSQAYSARYSGRR